MRTSLSLIILLLIGTSHAHAQNIEILFSGIRSAKGQIIVKIFTDDKGFDDDKPVKKIMFPKQGITGGEMRGKLHLDPGTYGFALLDDENSTGVMEYNFVGMPKEGFGFSNFYLTGMKKPHYEQFKFVLGREERRTITMKLRYL